MMNSCDTCGVLKVAELEVAVAAESLREVVRRPAVIKPVPLGPPYLAGFFNLRGTLIPTIDLRVLLQLPADAGAHADKVAIVSHGGLLLGLIVDGIVDVLRASQRQCIGIDYNAGPYVNVVHQALTDENDNRIIYLLDLEALVRIQNLPLAGNMAHAALAHESRRREFGRQYLVFRCGDADCAIDARSVKEIVSLPPLERSVLADALCEGAVRVRGIIVPVVGMTQLLGLPAACASASDQLLLVEIDTLLVGFRISAVVDIIRRADEDILYLPLFGFAKPAFFRGVLEHRTLKEILLIDHAHMLSQEEVRTITLGHSRLYDPEVMERRAQAKALREARRTSYLLFDCNGEYACELGMVLEVIDMPQDFSRVGGLHPCVLGIHNLHGRIVTLVDLGALDGAPESPPATGARVLVVQGKDCTFGFVIDAVASIESSYHATEIALPAIWTRNAAKKSLLRRHVLKLLEFQASMNRPDVSLIDLQALAIALEGLIDATGQVHAA